MYSRVADYFLNGCTIFARQSPDLQISRVEAEFAKYLIPKGSIAIDGISLTVVIDDETDTSYFDVHIIPHTWDNTNLQYLSIGDCVNLEFDQVGKYEIRQKMV